MQSLNNKQIELIISDVEEARITFSHLADELIDHICCEVEYEMNFGKTFDEAYDIVKQQTGIKVLQKIQESALYLIDKNYRRMKMTMKITGNLSLALLGIGTAMKLFHWAGAGQILILGFIIMCLVFFPSAIYTNYKEMKVKGSKLLHLSILIGGILFMAGVLFKVMHWPGAGQLLFTGWIFILFVFLPILMYIKLKEATSIKDKSIIMVGIAGLLIFELSTMFKIFHYPGAAVLMILGSILLVSVFLPLYTYSKFKETGKITGKFIYILISATFFMLLSILLAINVSTNVLDVFSKDGNNSKTISNYIESKNQKLYNQFNAKADSIKTKVYAIHDGTKKICSLIDSIRLELVITTDLIDKQTAEKRLLNVNLISNKADLNITNHLMIGKNANGMAYQLKQGLIKYQQTVLSETTSNTELSKNINIVLNTPDILINQQVQTWEQVTFNENIMIGTLAVLSDIEKRIRMVESQTIQHINAQTK